MKKTYTTPEVLFYELNSDRLCNGSNVVCTSPYIPITEEETEDEEDFAASSYRTNLWQ